MAWWILKNSATAARLLVLRASLLASCVRRSPLASFVDETQSRAQFVKQEKVARKWERGEFRQPALSPCSEKNARSLLLLNAQRRRCFAQTIDSAEAQNSSEILALSLMLYDYTMNVYEALLFNISQQARRH
jgi:hypothetical protein